MVTHGGRTQLSSNDHGSVYKKKPPAETRLCMKPDEQANKGERVKQQGLKPTTSGRTIRTMRTHLKNLEGVEAQASLKGDKHASLVLTIIVRRATLARVFGSSICAIGNYHQLAITESRCHKQISHRYRTAQRG
jgi:hypothetical protein